VICRQDFEWQAKRHVPPAPETGFPMCSPACFGALIAHPEQERQSAKTSQREGGQFRHGPGLSWKGHPPGKDNWR